MPLSKAQSKLMERGESTTQKADCAVLLQVSSGALIGLSKSSEEHVSRCLLASREAHM
jgi:hypothetical protein